VHFLSSPEECYAASHVRTIYQTNVAPGGQPKSVRVPGNTGFEFGYLFWLIAHAFSRRILPDRPMQDGSSLEERESRAAAIKKTINQFLSVVFNFHLI
jgi:hypothetical protein